MVSVTQRISQIDQPRGGYLPISKFEVIQLDDGKVLGKENVPGATVGMVVDYLSRWAISGDKRDAFRISLRGALRAGREEEAEMLFDGIKDMTNPSIVNACKLVGFDSYARGVFADYDPSTVNADQETCQNIRIMIDRIHEFHERFGAVTLEGFNLMGGYSRVVDRGDGDFLTEDTVWDLKVLRKDPESKHTLQLLMYYIMGKRSVHEEFGSVTKMGFFNPRLNKVHIIEASKIDPAIIKTVEDEVICYTGEESGTGNQMKMLAESLAPGSGPSDYPAFDQKLLALYFDDSDRLIPEAKTRLQKDPGDITANFILLTELLPCDRDELEPQLKKTVGCVKSPDELEQLLDLICTEFAVLCDNCVSRAEYSDDLAALPGHLEFEFRSCPANTEGLSPLLALTDVLLEWDVESCSCPEIISNFAFDATADICMTILDIKLVVEWVHRAAELCEKLSEEYDFDERQTDLFPPYCAAEFLRMNENAMNKALRSHSDEEYQKAIDFYFGDEPIMGYIPEKPLLQEYVDAKTSRFMSESKLKKTQKDIDKHWNDYFRILS